ncbi:MAG: hypothetical protein HXS50_00390 [Theionarchaea archaeon]|nr:hypothetical protein [Theionarchaea archaeon]
MSVLGNSEGGEAGDQEKPFWKFRWFRGFGPKNGDMTLEERIDQMAEKLGLTDDEVAEVTPIAQEIADLREQLKAKMEELREIIGPKVEAYRESKMAEMREGFRGMRGRWGRCCRPCHEIPEDSEEVTE